MFPNYLKQYSVKHYLKYDYYKKIKKYVKDVSVLDIGCVDENIAFANKIRLWNHWFIYKMAKKVIGIDIEKTSLDKMKSMGFNVLTMSAEKINFTNKFNTVFAGELIEHLANPGLFLQKAKRVLTPKGVIVLSTPNTYALNKLVRVFQFRTNNPPENPDHTMYFTPRNLETLCRKCGLKVIKIDYAHFPYTKDSFLSILNKIACRILGEIFKEQIIVVIR